MRWKGIGMDESLRMRYERHRTAGSGLNPELGSIPQECIHPRRLIRKSHVSKSPPSKNAISYLFHIAAHQGVQVNFLNISRPRRRVCKFLISTHQYTSVHISTHQHISAHVSTYQYTSVHIGTHQYIIIHINTNQYKSAHISTYEHTSVHISTYQYIWVHISTHQYTSVPLSSHQYILYMCLVQGCFS